MNKFYAIASCVALSMSICGNADAQQLANSDFEAGWGDCTPWTFFQSEGYFGQQSTVVTGKNPVNWVVSNVAGMASCYPDDETGELISMGLGATIVANDTTGYESEHAVALVNNPNPFMASQIVPGYLTLGTPWSTANPGFGLGGITINNSDGGAFGGIPFAARPKGIEFMYKRSHGEANPEENASVVAYLWKGHWTQNDVPVIVYMAGEPYRYNMIDRDRCVLGMDMANSQGGEVSKSDDAELIAMINTSITEDTDEWVKFTAYFDYLSDETPEMLNIVISSGDYFGSAETVGNGNTLIVDNVKLIYDEDNNKADKYPGSLTIEMMGGSLTEDPVAAEVNISYDDDNCTLVLPNFSLDLGSGATNLGDIVVKDVKTSVENGIAVYNGEVKGLSLLDGAIIADVTMTGTIDIEGNANFLIDVLWNDIPINVVFNGKGEPAKILTGINGINADNNAPVEFYNLKGMRMNGNNLPAGIYIKRQGMKTSKVVIK